MQASRVHQSTPAPKLTVKQKVDVDDVLLAYYKLPTVTLDTSVICNSTFSSKQTDEIVEMFPDPAGTLCDYTWNREHKAIWADVTNVFGDDEPLFYLHVCRLPTPNTDPAGVTISLADGREWPQDKKYTVIVRTGGGTARVYIYTNFLHDDEYVVSYTAEVADERGRKRVIPGYTETLYPQPVGVLSASEIPDLAGFTYNINTCSSYDSIKVTVNDGIVHDTRYPAPFRYSIMAEVTKSNGEKTVYQTPWQAETVYNPSCLTYMDETYYVNGRKVLDKRKVSDIMRPLIDKEVLSDPGTVVRYSVLSDNKYVQVSCRPDGEGVPYASTSVYTGSPPAVTMSPGKKWRYIEYTKESLAGLGFKGTARDIRIIASVTSGDILVWRHNYNIDGSYGFIDSEIIIRTEDVPAPGAGAVLEVELVNRTAGIDVQLYIDGQEHFSPDGKLLAKWEDVKRSGQAVIKIREVYRPGCFVRLYGVRLVRNIPLQINVPEQDENTPWHVYVRHGQIVRNLDDSTALLYGFTLEPRIRTVSNVPARVLDGNLVKFRHGPLLSGVKIDGYPANIVVRIDGTPVKIEWYDPISGVAKIAAQPKQGSLVTASYSYRVDWIEYRGYMDIDRYRGLNLNPAGGNIDPVDRKFYIYMKPSAKLSNIRRIYQERLVPFRIGRTGKELLWHARLERVPINSMDVRVYKHSGEEIPYNSGGTYWTWSPVDQNVIIIHNPDISPDPVGRATASYSVDYYYHSCEWHIKETYDHRNYLTHSEDNTGDEDELLLGTVEIVFNCKPKDTILYDARSRGGGIKEELLPEASKIEHESRHYFDIGYWDGEPWQAGGTVKLFLPDRLKQKPYWSEKSINDKVNKHKTSGNLVLVDYWNAEEKYPDRPGHLVVSLVDIGDEAGFVPPRHLVLEIVIEP